MNLSKKKTRKLINFQRRQTRTRTSLLGAGYRPRLSVYRSNKFISAQIIDDLKSRTLVAVSETELDAKTKKSSKTERAFALGKLLANKASSQKITKVIFDRSGYNYHGRVKALADGARSGGLDF